MDGRSPFLSATFVWTKTRIEHRTHGALVRAARTWPKSGNAEEQANALAGFHGDYVLFVIDESGGVPQAVMVAVEAVLSGIETKVVQAGNPTHLTGPLYRACTTEKHLWHVVDDHRRPRGPEAIVAHQ